MSEQLVSYFEDFVIGERCHSMGRTITETDIVAFAGLSGDYNRIHTDLEYAQQSFLGKRVAHGLLVLSIASGLYTRTSFGQRITDSLVALIKISDWKFEKPVFINDTISIEVEVKEIVDRYPEKNMGTIIFHRNIVNQHRVTVQQGDFHLLIKKRQVQKQ